MDGQLKFPTEGDKVYFRSQDGQVQKHLFTNIRHAHDFHCLNQAWSIEDQYGEMYEVRPYGEEWAQVLDSGYEIAAKTD